MGLEAYLFYGGLDSKNDRDTIVPILEKLGYSFTHANRAESYYEKKTDMGYLDFAVPKEGLLVSVRTAKPNHVNVIETLFSDVETIKESIQLQLKDTHSKLMVIPDNYLEIKANFIKLQEEFAMYFPMKPYPIRCKDVFKRTE